MRQVKVKMSYTLTKPQEQAQAEFREGQSRRDIIKPVIMIDYCVAIIIIAIIIIK